MTAIYEDGRWRIDKRLSVGHLLTVASVMAALVAWWFQIQGRIERSEIRIAANEIAIVEMKAIANAQSADIIRRLERIDSKIDAHLQMHSE